MLQRSHSRFLKPSGHAKVGQAKGLSKSNLGRWEPPLVKLCYGSALPVMLGMALGRIKEKQKENMRSLVRMAA